MDSVFPKQSRGCGFDTRLIHMPVMLETNVHPDTAHRVLPYYFFLFKKSICSECYSVHADSKYQMKVWVWIINSVSV